MLAENISERNKIIEFTNKRNIVTRPIWMPMHKLDPFKSCYHDKMANTEWLANRIVIIPSSVTICH